MEKILRKKYRLTKKNTFYRVKLAQKIKTKHHRFISGELASTQSAADTEDANSIWMKSSDDVNRNVDSKKLERAQELEEKKKLRQQSKVGTQAIEQGRNSGSRAR